MEFNAIIQYRIIWKFMMIQPNPRTIKSESHSRVLHPQHCLSLLRWFLFTGRFVPKHAEASGEWNLSTDCFIPLFKGLSSTDLFCKGCQGTPLQVSYLGFLIEIGCECQVSMKLECCLPCPWVYLGCLSVVVREPDGSQQMKVWVRTHGFLIVHPFSFVSN